MSGFCHEHNAPSAYCYAEGLHSTRDVTIEYLRRTNADPSMRTMIGEVLSERLIRDLRNEAIRAHRKHSRPENGGGSLVDPNLEPIKKLAALIEEIGEVAEESPDDPRLGQLIIHAGSVARMLTYDGGGDPATHKPRLRKELLQTANVAATWAQSLDRDEVSP